jgi:hypothetical protein
MAIIFQLHRMCGEALKDTSMNRFADADDPATGPFDTGTLVDTGRYPIDRTRSDAYRDAVRQARAGLEQQSCAMLRQFIRGEALEQMRAEAVLLEPGAVHVETEYNPYFDDVPDDLPSDHPRRRVSRRTNGMVRGDKFERAGAIWALFKNPHMLQLVADCLGIAELHTYRDPFGCMNINVQAEGSEFAWHFDNNDFTVSVILQKPEDGGIFEYVPGLRTPRDPGYDEVKKVLDGDSDAVCHLDLQPGDLQLFKGRYALHRVTAPTGPANRLSLLLGYVEDREKMASPTFSRNLWGEVHPLQETAQRAR